MARLRYDFALALATTVALSGCPGKADPAQPTTPRASGRPTVVGTARPAIAPGVPVVAALTGKVKLLSDFGGAVVGNNGGTIISNNGGTIVSNNGGHIVANNGGGVIANNGSSVVANNGGSFRLAQAAAPLPEAFLADAVVTAIDAAGQPILDPDGKPLTATTDQSGAFSLSGTLPARGLLLEVKLWNGGVLRALVARDALGGATAREVPIDTASSLGAAYVMTRFVKGDQATFDKLPDQSVAQLHREVEASRGLLDAVPRYQADELVALGEALRAGAPAVDRALEDIRVLLLGQVNLGAGRLATEVPIFLPTAIAALADGTLYITENETGRVRRVAPDGTIDTFIDQARGTVPLNFRRPQDMVTGPDGALYVLADRLVRRITPDGTLTTVVGAATATLATPSVGAAGTALRLNPLRMAFGPDGQLHLILAESDSAGQLTHQLVTIGRDGLVARVVDLPRAQFYYGIAVRSDGAVVLLTAAGGTVDLRVLGDGGTLAVLGTARFDVRDFVNLVADDQGTVYVPDTFGNRVVAVAKDGTSRVLAGVGAPAGARQLLGPTGVARKADGTLFILCALPRGVTFVLRPDGHLVPWAGRDPASAVVGGGNALPFNGPLAIAFDRANRMLVAEGGGGVVRAFDGSDLITVAGGGKGTEEGGRATDDLLVGVGALVGHGDDLYLSDAGTMRLRQVAADGTIRTVLGLAGSGQELASKLLAHPGLAPQRPGESRLGTNTPVDRCLAMAWGPDDALYFADLGTLQVRRLGRDGRVTLVAGKGRTSVKPELGGLLGSPTGPALAHDFGAPAGLAFDKAGALYVSDLQNGHILRITDPGGAAPSVASYIGLPLGETLARQNAGGTPNADGDAKDVGFVGPTALCFDAAGNLYVCEQGTKYVGLADSRLAIEFKLPVEIGQIASRIRKLSPDGQVTTVVGPGGRHFVEPTAEDGLVFPTGIAIDPQGRLAIADPGANLLRLIPAGQF